MKARRAFTLIEVLISLVVFAIAAVTLGAAYVSVLRAYELVGSGGAQEDEVRFARQQLMIETDREKAEEGGEFQAASGGQVTWRAAIEQTTIADVFRVTFTCNVAQTGTSVPRPPIVETFMLLRPTWSEGLDATKLRQESKDRILKLGEKMP